MQLIEEIEFQKNDSEVELFKTNVLKDSKKVEQLKKLLIRPIPPPKPSHLSNLTSKLQTLENCTDNASKVAIKTVVVRPKIVSFFFLKHIINYVENFLKRYYLLPFLSFFKLF